MVVASGISWTRRWAFRFEALLVSYECMICTTCFHFKSLLPDHHHLYMSSKPVTVAVINEDPSTYESRHVHNVYDQIASHFSTTRYKVRSPPGTYLCRPTSLPSHGPSYRASYLSYRQDGWVLTVGRATESTCPSHLSGPAPFARSD